MVIQTNTASREEDRLYAMLDNSVTEQPPPLPPDRVPYYQEIESDKTSAPYDTLIPMAQPKPDSVKQENGEILHDT